MALRCLHRPQSLLSPPNLLLPPPGSVQLEEKYLTLNVPGCGCSSRHVPKAVHPPGNWDQPPPPLCCSTKPGLTLGQEQRLLLVLMGSHCPCEQMWIFFSLDLCRNQDLSLGRGQSPPSA